METAKNLCMDSIARFFKILGFGNWTNMLTVNARTHCMY